MSIFLDETKLSVKCHRKKHELCKNKQGNCGCECHVVNQKNNESLKDLLDYYNDDRLLAWIRRVLK